MAGKKAANKKEKRADQKKSSKQGKSASHLTLDAPVEQYFILCNGQPVKNVKELAEVIEDLRDDVFNHHVTPDKNDFATWIHDVFKDVELAQDLAGVKDKKNTRIVLYKHLVKSLHK